MRSAIGNAFEIDAARFALGTCQMEWTLRGALLVLETFPAWQDKGIQGYIWERLLPVYIHERLSLKIPPSEARKGLT